MRFSIALDERDQRDQAFVVNDVPLLVDPFTLTTIRGEMQVHYNEVHDTFSVFVPEMDASSC